MSAVLETSVVAHVSPAPAVDAAERDLLSHMYAGPYEKRLVRLPRSGHLINTLSAGCATAPTLVVVHGWGAGVAFFGRNLAGLSTHFRVHLVDWLGFGASSRPFFSTRFSPSEAENFFLDALEEWTDAMRLLEPLSAAFAPFHLCGHSLGAFLSVGFTLRRPDLVRSLVLASPVGVPHPPRVPRRAAHSLVWRVLRCVIFRLWDLGATPQLLLRLAGAKFGRAIAARMVRPRFPADTAPAQDALIEYFYQLSRAPASGEHSLSTILRSGAYARVPLWDKLPLVVHDVAFLYGDRDWMDWKAARELQQFMKGDTRLCVVENAGHHLYYDRPEEFNRLVVQACLGKMCMAEEVKS